MQIQMLQWQECKQYLNIFYYVHVFDRIFFFQVAYALEWNLFVGLVVEKQKMHWKIDAEGKGLISRMIA